VIAPLLWLLLSSLGLLHPTPTGVHTWEGRAPVVVTHPSQPTAGDIVTVGIAGLPARAKRVAVVAATDRYPATHNGTLWETSFQPHTEGGPLNLSVRFMVGDRQYLAPGGVVFVKPKNPTP
jgi:hypothetical protein